MTKPPQVNFSKNFEDAIYSFKGATLLSPIQFPSGLMFLAENQWIVLYSHRNQMAILVISRFVNQTDVLEGINAHGLAKLCRMRPEYGLSGMVIRDYLGTQLQYVPGPLTFYIDEEKLSDGFGWNFLKFELLRVHYLEESLKVTIWSKWQHVPLIPLIPVMIPELIQEATQEPSQEPIQDQTKEPRVFGTQ